MHVIALSPGAAGWLQAYPAGPRPTANATLNFAAGKNSSGFEVVPVSSTGEVSFYSTTTAKLWVRLVGYYTSAAAEAPGSTYVPLAPVRLANAVSVGAGGSTTIPVAGANGVAAAEHVTAASVVVVAGAPAAAGYVQAYPASATPTGDHAGLYFPAAETRSVVFTTPLSSDGKLTVKSAVASKLSVYLRGYYLAPTSDEAAGASYVPVAPATVANNVALAANGTTTLTLAGANAIPPASQVAAVATNLSATTPTGTGYLQSWPDGDPPVDASLHFTNAVPQGDYDLSRISGEGKTTVKASAPTRIYTRLRGYFKRATPPAAPTNVTATRGNASATITWAPSTGDGGALVTGYTVTASPGGYATTVGSSATTATVGGLKNGTAYTFTVVATNASGDSGPSPASEPVTPDDPVQPPGAPFITDVYPRDGAVRVSWSPSNSGFGSATKYVVTASPGGATAEVPGESTQAVVSGLTNGTEYTFVVVAANGAGLGSQSAASSPVEPEPGDVPLAPPLSAVVASNERVDVQWVAPTDGGSPITGYTVSVEPGGHTRTVAADTTVAALTGLTNGTTHTVTVVASNKHGASAPGTSAGVVPAAERVPQPPVDVRVGVSGAGAVEVEWAPPADPGTSKVTSYTVTAAPNGPSVTVTGIRAAIHGLNTATAYTFTVTATNATGPSGPSDATRPITPTLAVKKMPRVLSPTAAAALRDVHSDGTLDFIDPPPEVLSLAAGDLLIARVSPQTPMGLFRKVTGVKTINGLVVVSTTPAALSEALGQGAMAISSVIGDGDITGFTAATPGVRRLQPTLKGRTLRQGAPRAQLLDSGPSIGLRDGTMVLSIEEAFGPTNGVNTKLAAIVKLTPSVDGDMDVSLEGVDTDFKLRVKQEVQARVKVGVALSWTKTRRLASLQIGCVVVPVGGFPVVICLNFDVNLTMSADGTVGIALSTGYTREFGVNVRSHNADVQATPINNAGRFDAPDFDIYGDASASVGIPLGLTLYFYGLAGPGVEATPYLKAIADTTLDPWWELREGIKFSVYFRSKEFFGHSINFTKDLGDVWRSLKNAGGPFNGMKILPQHSQIQPGQSTQLRVDVSHHPDDIPVQWRVIHGPGQINADGRYSSEINGVALIEAVGTVNGLRSDILTARAAIQVGDSPPQAPREVSAQPGPLSATVKWSPPANPGGSPVTRYIVTTQPPTSSVPVPGSVTTAQIRWLDPRLTYTIQVYAENAQGFGPPAQTGPIQALKASHRLGSITNIAVDELGKPDTTGTVGDRSIALAGNGRVAFFTVEARSNLAPPEVARANDTTTYLVRKDLDSGAITLASRGTDGATPLAVSSERSNPLKASSVATNLDGAVVAFLTTTVPPRLYVNNLSTGHSWHANAGVPNDHTVDSPALSDDGNTVAFRAQKPWVNDAGGAARLYRRVNNQRLQQIDMADTCTFGDTPCPFGLAPSMSGDGKRIAYEGPRTKRYGSGYFVNTIAPMVYDAATGSTMNLFTDDPDVNGPYGRMVAEAIFSPSISRDGKVIAMDYHIYASAGAYDRGIATKVIGAGYVDHRDLVVRTRDTQRLGVVPSMSRTGNVFTYDFDGTSGRLYDRGNAQNMVITQVGSNETYYRTQLSDNGQVAAWNLPTSGGVWATRYMPAGVCRAHKYYAPLDGKRAQRITAQFCSADDLEGGTKASPSKRPPGFPEPNPGSKFARGHLLARQLGGSGDILENLVTLHQSRANTPSMKGLEDQVRQAVEQGKEEVYYEVFPIYADTQEMPTGIVIKADGNKGFHLSKLVENTEEGKVIDYP